MTDVIIPTWAEVNGLIVIAIGVLAFIVWALIKAKQEERTVTWIRDWDEPNIKEDW